MGKPNNYLRRAFNYDGVGLLGYSHWCPACKETHPFAVDVPLRNGARWSFNGNFETPSFHPSMNISVGPFPDGRIERCHYFLKAGAELNGVMPEVDASRSYIQFLGDCTHELKGQVVPLPELPEHLRDP